MKRTFFTLLTALIVSLGCVSPVTHAASSGLYFSPTSGSVVEGKPFGTVLRIAGGSATDLKIHFTYDPSVIVMTGYGYDGSSFSSTINSDYASGSVTITSSQGSTGSTDRLIANLSFKAVHTGTSSLMFSGTNQSMDSLLNLGLIGSGWTNVATTNAQYSVVSASDGASTTLPPPATGTTPPSSSTSRTSTQPATPSSNTRTKTPAQKPSSNDQVGADTGSAINFISTPNDPTAFTHSKNAWSAAIIPASIIGLALLCVAVFFGYRGYRIAHLKQWYRRLAADLLAQSPDDATPMPLVLKPVRAALRLAHPLLSYHPMKLLASGPVAKRPLLSAGTRAPLAKRRNIN